MRRAALVATVLAAVAAPLAHDRVTTRVTWTRDIAPIVTARCAGCHQPSGPAPMSLATYDAARPWATAMRFETATRRMPKWAAARGIGRFTNDRSLPPFEAALIAAWADGGAPLGDPVAVEASPRRQALGEVALRLPRRTAPPEGETAAYTIELRTRRDVWVTAWRFYPNDPAIVSADFYVSGDRPLLSWTPPDDWVQVPAGSGMWLPAGTAIRGHISFRSNKLQQDFPVGLPRLPPVLALVTSGRVPPRRRLSHLDTPCGEASVSGTIAGLRPLLAASGDPVGTALVSDDAPPLPLLWVRAFDPAHRPTYWLADPVAIRPGARMLVDSAASPCVVRVSIVD